MSGQKISLPRVTYTNVPAQVAISNAPQRVLMVGYQETTNAADGTLVENILNDNSHRNQFGNSMLTQMIDAYKEMNGETALDVIPLAPPSGAGSAEKVYRLTVVGTATDTGEIEINPETMRTRVRVSVTKDMTAEQVAAAINTQFGTSASRSLLTSAIDGSDATLVNLTAASAGAFTDKIGINISVDVPGITVTLSSPAAGAGTTDLTGVLDVIGSQRYQTIVWPFPDDTDEVVNLLTTRWNVSNDVLDGVVFSCDQDTLANHLTYLATKNDLIYTYLANGIIDEATRKGGDILSNPWVISSTVCAIRALRLTEDALLTLFLTSIAAKDQFGGPALASLPYFNTLLPFMKPMAKGVGFTDTEVLQINEAGGMVIGNNQSQTNVIIGEAITTYKTDPAGNPDPTYHFLNSVDQASVAREYFYNNTKKRFAQSRLTSGAVKNGRDMANVQVIRAFLIGLYGDLASDDYVIVQDGPDFVKFFKDNLSVELNLVEGKVTISAKLCYMSQARQWIGTLEYSFDIEGQAQ